jgi:hypothetical protein
LIGRINEYNSANGKNIDISLIHEETDKKEIVCQIYSYNRILTKKENWKINNRKRKQIVANSKPQKRTGCICASA